MINIPRACLQHNYTIIKHRDVRQCLSNINLDLTVCLKKTAHVAASAVTEAETFVLQCSIRAQELVSLGHLSASKKRQRYYLLLCFFFEERCSMY